MQKIIFLGLFINISLITVAQNAPPVVAPSPSKPAESKTLLYEKFDNNVLGWPGRPYVKDRKQASGEIVDGTYQAITGPQQQVLSLIDLPIKADSRFSISIKLQTIMNLFEEGAGFAFGSNGSNMYLLLIQNHQKYCVMKLAEGNQSFVIPWTKTDALIANGTNTISLLGAAGKWRVAINSKPVMDVAAQPFFGDALGMMQAGNQHNRFDDFIVREWTIK